MLKNILKVKDKYFLDVFPQTIKTLKSGRKQLEYFIQGEGYKKTVKFEVVGTIEFEKKSWYEIAKITDKYGLEVGYEFANMKTAGIIARQTARGYCAIYRKIKDIIPEDFNEDFFDCLKTTYTLACIGCDSFDIGDTDEALGRLDPEYNDAECTYKGKIVSMREYVTEKYGKIYAVIINKLNKSMML